jgi:hypothetical protein
MALIGFPLLLIPFAIYNIVAFLMPGVGFAVPVAQVHLSSGAAWDVTFGDLLIAIAILLLLLELIKAARMGRRSIVDHGLALLLFIGITAEFILVRQAATSTFFLLTVISFVEAFGGFAFALRPKQRAMVIEASEPASAQTQYQDVIEPAPVFDPPRPVPAQQLGETSVPPETPEPVPPRPPAS